MDVAPAGLRSRFQWMDCPSITTSGASPRPMNGFSATSPGEACMCMDRRSGACAGYSSMPSATSEFWSAREEVHRIWMSVYTPQRGEAERGAADQGRSHTAGRGDSMRYPGNIRSFCQGGMTRAILSPPPKPRAMRVCRVSANYTADLRTRVTPCVFGGDPDCSQCGCAISSALHWITNEKLGPLRARHL